MKQINIKTLSYLLVLSAFVLSFSLNAVAQEPVEPKKSDPHSMKEHQDKDKMNDKTKAGSEATLTARLVDPEKKAEGKAATVEVTVKGVSIIDPAKSNEIPKKGQAHLHYQLDDGPVIATTSTKLSFHGLSSGQHKIVVMLAANDHQPLGPQETLTLTVP